MAKLAQIITPQLLSLYYSLKIDSSSLKFLVAFYSCVVAFAVLSVNKWTAFPPVFCWGGIGMKNNLNFGVFLRHAKKGQGFSATIPFLDSYNARTRGRKTCQKYPKTRVHRCASSGKHVGSEGWTHTRAPVPTLPRKWVPSDTPISDDDQSQTPPLQQRAADSLARTKWKFLWFFSHSKMVLPAVQALFPVHKIVRTFFTVLPKGLLRIFTIFRTFLSVIFRTVFCWC